MGLIGGIARTAVAAGTWTAVSNRVSQRQYNRWAQQEQQYAPGPQQYAAAPQQYAAPAAAQAPTAAPAPAADPVQQLKDLADLRAKGILTDEEFAAQKARVLAT